MSADEEPSSPMEFHTPRAADVDDREERKFLDSRQAEKMRNWRAKLEEILELLPVEKTIQMTRDGGLSWDINVVADAFSLGQYVKKLYKAEKPDEYAIYQYGSQVCVPLVRKVGNMQGPEHIFEVRKNFSDKLHLILYIKEAGYGEDGPMTEVGFDLSLPLRASEDIKHLTSGRFEHKPTHTVLNLDTIASEYIHLSGACIHFDGDQ